MRQVYYKRLAQDSCIFRQGLTSCLVKIKQAKKLKYQYTMNPLSSGSSISKKSRMNRRALEIEHLGKLCIMRNFPEETSEIKAEVLTSDGGTRTCCLNAATRLLNRDQNKSYFFSAFGLVDDKFVLDLNYEQDSNSEVDIPVGFLYQGGHVTHYTYLQLDGKISPKKLMEGLLILEKETIVAYSTL
jgi:ribonuclease PH